MQHIPQTNYAAALLDGGAGKANDGDVRKAVLNAVQDLLGTATHVPASTAPELTLEESRLGAKAKPAFSAVEGQWGRQQAGDISMVMMGEAHDNTDDHQRSVDFVVKLATLPPAVLVVERALTYTAPGNALFVVREDNLTSNNIHNWALTNGLSPAQRSMIVAGYMVLVTAGGDQDDISNFAILFGERHADIATHFEYFVRHTKASYVSRRRRSFTLVSSNSR